MKQKKRNTLLWVIGWILFFPIPLTILLLRNKKINPKVKYGILTVVWLIVIMFCFYSSNNDASNQASTPADIEETISIADADKEPGKNVSEDSKESEQTEVPSTSSDDKLSEQNNSSENTTQATDPTAETNNNRSDAQDVNENKNDIVPVNTEPSADQPEPPQNLEPADTPVPTEKPNKETGQGTYVVNGKNGKIHINGRCTATKEGSNNFMDIQIYFDTYEEAESYSSANFPNQKKLNCGNCF